MDLLLLTADPDPAAVLPALDLLPVAVATAPPEAASLVTAGRYELVLVDARSDLTSARSLCRLLGTDNLGLPVLAILTEGGLAVVGPDWGVADVVLSSAGPAEVHARLRLLGGRSDAAGNAGVITIGELTVEEDTYSARLRGRALELTYKEFELLKYLAQHPGRVFTREQLVAQVWGYDFFGGTRTVDVHVRRLRAKLGPEYEAMIGTVRHVGYKMVVPSRSSHRAEPDREHAPGGDQTPVRTRT
jgi:DNA-binding response OmpR family regulator